MNRIPVSPRRLGALLALATFLIAADAPAATLPLEEIPVESPLYGSLEDLATRHSSPIGFLLTRPWTLGDARAFLDALVRSGCGCERDPAFLHVRREVNPEARQAPLRLSAADTASIEFSPYARLVYRAQPPQVPGVVRDYRVGLGAAADLRGQALVFADYYAATWSPGPHGNPIVPSRFSLAEGANFTAWFDRAFVAAGAGALRARIGHTWLRWGPGRSGTLGLGDASRALDLAEVRWRLLPSSQLTWFLAWLDPLQQSYLAGHRLELHPFPALSLGASELARFSGTSQVPLYLVPVVAFKDREKQLSRFADTSTDTQQVFSKNNVLWTADASWRIRQGLVVYGELLVDDISFSSAYRPPEIGYQFGGRASRLFGQGNAGCVRFEYTRIYNFTYSTWHKHDFESGGLPLAYPYGPDVEVIFAELEWDRGPSWVFTLGGSRVHKGEGSIGKPWSPEQGKVDNIQLSGVVERTWRGLGSVAYRPGRRLSVDAQAGWVVVHNLEHVPGRTANRWFGSAGLNIRM